MQPLKGLTVVTLEHAIAAPFATRQLADLGARVIKIERPGTGDFARGYDERVRGLASHFVWTNRSKESLTLDVKHPDAAKVLERLVLEKADVVVQNLAPGAAARLGLGYEALAAKKPAIIVCDISGYGADGPYRDKKAYDLLIQSEAGFVSVTGTPDEPCKAGPSIADIAAGMYAYTNILAALLQRGTDRARPAHRHLDAGVAGRMDELPAVLRLRRRAAAAAHRRGARHHLPLRPVPDRRGNGSVMLGLQNEREWVNFCDKVLLRPELARDPRFAGNAKRVAERDALRADHRRRLRAADGAAGGRAAGGGADRQRARQHDARGLGAPAAEGARPLARGRLAGRPAAGDAAARHLGRGPAHGPGAGARRAHRRDPARSWASTPKASARCVPRRPI